MKKKLTEGDVVLGPWKGSLRGEDDPEREKNAIMIEKIEKMLFDRLSEINGNIHDIPDIEVRVISKVIGMLETLLLWY